VEEAVEGRAGMKTFLTRNIALCLLLPASVVFANSNEHPSIDALYEQGTRQMPQPWVGLGKTHESAVFLHKEIQKAEKDRVAVWRGREFAFTEYLDKQTGYLSSRERVLVDCKSQTIGISDRTYYTDRFASGQNAETRKFAAPTMTAVVPDTLDAQLLKIVCAPKPHSKK
jgi:hypothetical protein